MSSGGGTTTQTAQTQTAPWQPAQPYLTDLFGQAQGTYQNAQGQGGTYPNTVAPFSPTTQSALSGITNLAQQGPAPIVGQADNSLANILAGNSVQGGALPGNQTLEQLSQNGYSNPATPFYEGMAANGYSNPGASVYQGLTGGYNNPGNSYASTLTGGPSLGTSQTALSAIANSNPTTTANAVFAAGAPQVQDAVNSQFEAGDRVGSASNQQELTRNLGQLAATDYGQAVNNVNNAASSLAGINTAGYNSQSNLADLLSNNANNQVQTILSAAGGLSNNAQNQANAKLTAAGGLTNNAANEANVMGGAAQNLNTGATTQGQQATTASAFAVPSLANQQYVPLQNELTAGQTYDAQNQAQLNNNLAQWSYGQQQPWNILNNYSGVLTGLGSLGGTSNGTSSTTQPSQSLLPSLIGGGLNFAGSAGGSSLLSSLLGI